MNADRRPLTQRLRTGAVHSRIIAPDDLVARIQARLDQADGSALEVPVLSHPQSRPSRVRIAWTLVATASLTLVLGSTLLRDKERERPATTVSSLAVPADVEPATPTGNHAAGLGALRELARLSTHALEEGFERPLRGELGALAGDARRTAESVLTGLTRPFGGMLSPAREL
jgi:hypothetical protein